MLHEGLVDFRNVDTAPVIQNGIQSFQHSLTSQVQFIQDNPVSLFQGLEQDSVMPLKLDFVIVLLGQIGSQQVDHVRLFRESQLVQLLSSLVGQELDKRSLSTSRVPFQQNRLIQLQPS